MTFRFGLFRVLTFANIIVFGLLGLVTIFVLGQAPAMAIFFLLLITPAFLHNQRCLKLQRLFLRPEMPVNPGLPMSINFSSIGAFIWGGILLINLINILLLTPGELHNWAAQLVKVQKEMKAANPSAAAAAQEISVDDYLKLLKGMITFVGIHAVCVITNCILSIQYSRLLKNRLPEEEDETV